jgi:chemotaxis protein CheZ
MGAMSETEDLEALFDQVAAQSAREREAAPGAAAAQAPRLSPSELTAYDVFRRIGELTRSLHDALRELGYDKSLETAVGALPDARARLAYVASLTGKAAERVLGAVERGKILQEQLRDRAAELHGRWELLYAGKLPVEAFKALAGETRDWLAGVPQTTAEADRELTEIMLAQDFHDLSGQVIQRIASVAQNLEDQLVRLLLDTTPPERRNELQEGWLSGPAIHAERREDVVTSQSQVDDLLESLGF